MLTKVVKNIYTYSSKKTENPQLLAASETVFNISHTIYNNVNKNITK